MKSRTKKRGRVLAGRVSAAQAKEFLEELANLPSAPARIKAFERRFGHLFLSEVPRNLVRFWAMNTVEEHYFDLSDTELLREFWLLPLRDTLRTIWKASDVSVKEWGVFKIREVFFVRGEPALLQVPMQDQSNFFLTSVGRPGQCDQILLYFLKAARLARCCANPDCNFVPYFFATRPTQKYCSETCALPAQREAKRRWWTAHGSQLRRKATLKKQGRTRG